MIVAWWFIAGGVFGAISGALAIPRNRSALLWWMAGFATGPIALALLLTKGARQGRPALW